jgi:hypothetical protein
MSKNKDFENALNDIRDAGWNDAENGLEKSVPAWALNYQDSEAELLADEYELGYDTFCFTRN